VVHKQGVPELNEDGLEESMVPSVLLAVHLEQRHQPPPVVERPPELRPLEESRRNHPVELVRALAITWLFSGLRSDEIVRLRVGCVRWQPGAGGAYRVCLLGVHQTSRSTGGSGDRSVGSHPSRPTAPVGSANRGARGAPVLLAGQTGRGPVLQSGPHPRALSQGRHALADARGRITSHRARSTIASQPYNDKEAMTLLELQA
jgi:hypothetical protein